MPIVYTPALRKFMEKSRLDREEKAARQAAWEAQQAKISQTRASQPARDQSSNYQDLVIPLIIGSFFGGGGFDGGGGSSGGGGASGDF